MRKAILTTAGVATIFSVATFLGTGGHASAAAVSPQIEAALTGVLAADQGVVSAPYGSTSEISNPPAMASVQALVATTTTEKTTASQRLESGTSFTAATGALLAGRFTGDALAEEQQRASGLEQGASDVDVMQLGGGVAGIKVSSATMSGTTAHIVAIAQDWLVTAVRQPTGQWAIAAPVNDVQYTVDLRLNGSSWIATELSWKFVTAP